MKKETEIKRGDLNQLDNKKMKREIILTLMIGWDFSLHAAELFGFQDNYILWPEFSSRVIYTIFWFFFWEIGFVISLSLIDFHKVIKFFKRIKC